MTTPTILFGRIGNTRFIDHAHPERFVPGELTVLSPGQEGDWWWEMTSTSVDPPPGDPCSGYLVRAFRVDPGEGLTILELVVQEQLDLLSVPSDIDRSLPYQPNLTLPAGGPPLFTSAGGPLEHALPRIALLVAGMTVRMRLRNDGQRPVEPKPVWSQLQACTKASVMHLYTTLSVSGS